MNFFVPPPELFAVGGEGDFFGSGGDKIFFLALVFFSLKIYISNDVSDWPLEAKKLTNLLKFSPAAQYIDTNSLYLNLRLQQVPQFCY